MKRLIVLLGAVTSLAGCGGGPEFQRYVGPSGETKGSGGTVETVAGVDFWQNGTPPRKFRILGEFDDEWRGGGLERSDMKYLARHVKEQGGDAAIFVSAERELGNANLNGIRWDEAVKLAVIKYE